MPAPSSLASLQTKKADRRLVALAVGLMFALMLSLPVVALVKTHSRSNYLAAHGVTTPARVVGSTTRGETDYLWVDLMDGGCACHIAVSTTALDRHPLGSALPVRYDPRHPSHAQALVDSASTIDDAVVFLVGIGASIVLLVPIILMAQRRKRASKALLQTRRTMRVRVEPWRRTTRQNVPVYFLSVYAEGSPATSEPLLAFAVTSDVVRQLRNGMIFDLFGPAEPGKPVALRSNDVTVLTASKAHDSAWEQKHRKPFSDVPLDDFVPTTTVTSPRSGVFATSEEARAYYRGLRLDRLFLPFAIAAPVIRLVPDSYVWPTMAIVFGLLGAMAVRSWRRTALLDRLAAREAGVAPQGRKERREARARVVERINSERGQNELAGRLSTTTSDLAAATRRTTYTLVASFGGMAALFAVFVLRLAVS